jgi:hypothetical protein
MVDTDDDLLEVSLLFIVGCVRTSGRAKLVEIVRPA